MLLSPYVAHAQPAGDQPQNINVEVRLAQGAERKPVPMEVFRRLLLFKARVDGQDVWALLDNGTDFTLIDSGFATSRKLNVTEQVGQVQSATGSLAMGRVLNVLLEIPGQVSFRPPLYVTDLSGISKSLGVPVSLVVGRDTFAFLSFIITPSTRSFELAPSGAVNVPANTPTLVLKDDKPRLEVIINGKPAIVSVDLGDTNNITLGPAAWDRLGLSSLPTVLGTSTGGDGKVMESRTAIVDTVAVGAFQARQSPVAVQPIRAQDGDGRIGMGFFAGFNFVFDLKARRIWLLSPVGFTPSEINAAAQSAVRLYRAGLISEAEKQLADLRTLATSAEALNSLCWVKATNAVQVASAVQDCTEAVRQSNGNPDFVDSLGMALLQAGRLQESLDAYSQAIEKKHPAASYMGRAFVHAKMGNLTLAQADRAEALKRDPAVEKLYADMGLQLPSDLGKAASKN